MRLHTVLITYNRLDLTKRALDSYVATVTAPWSVMIVDNGSTDGTLAWLANESPAPFLSLGQNRYPGVACNRGWALAPHDANVLHRADNDFEFLPGWCEELARCFKDPTVGQVGLRTDAEEEFAPANVGGCNAIRRELWDAGLRYDERPWPTLREELGRGTTEDTLMSPAVIGMGYRWRRVERPCVANMATNDPDDPYYVVTHRDRGLVPDPARLGLKP